MYEEGDRVTVYLPLSEQTISRKMRKLNGIEATISKVMKRTPKHGTTLNTFYLEGVVTEAGLPYEFCKDWLIPAEEV